MKEKVTIIPKDTIVIVEGEGLSITSFDAIELPNSLAFSQIHAIQWKNGVGHVEFEDMTKSNKKIAGTENYATWVAPFVTLWETKKVQFETEQVNAETEALTLYNSTEARAERLRGERDRRISACDWVITRHRDELDQGEGATLSTYEYTTWLAYRKSLRDLPSLEGFPWSGGGMDDDACPWPVEPV